jgi:hypothetical protein
MQEDSDFEIINLNPNVDYESDSSSSYSDDEDNEVSKSNNDNNVVVINNEKIAQHDQNEIRLDSEMNELKHENVNSNSNSNDCFNNELIKPRKKLNLQQYKLHRANKPAPTEIICKNVLQLCENVPDSLPIIHFPTDPRSIRNLLNHPTSDPELVEPMDIDSSIASEQVLSATDEKEIMYDFNSESNSATVNEIEYEQEEQQQIEAQTNEPSIEIATTIVHPDYEELVLISMGCNSDITIPPKEIDEEYENKPSTKFLTNIVNSLQEPSTKTLLNSSTTLFSSINAILQEKCVNAKSDVETNKTADCDGEYGENKVIMHLKKDRLRPIMCTIAIQTDTTPLFPPLILSPSLIFNRIKNSKNYRRKLSRSRSRTRSRSRSFSPEHDYYRRCTGSQKYARSLHSTYSSMNSSEMDSSSESDSSAYSSGKSSDRDSVQKYGSGKYAKTYGQYRQRNNNNSNNYYGTFSLFQLFSVINNHNFSLSDDQRKIIYVGGLTEQSTKEELRRKFLKYGTIKKITMHAKDDG